MPAFLVRSASYIAGLSGTDPCSFVNRIELGNFGDHKFCRYGVWELRIDIGAGYRVYYATAGKEIVLLLCAGDKRTQAADIDRACAYWQDWQRSEAKTPQTQ
ncbi:MAG: putative addiction module killer protein [Herbaspirillum sp.]|nr:putative addiction module killer protein [Herbaspirillum sp.]